MIHNQQCRFSIPAGLGHAACDCAAPERGSEVIWVVLHLQRGVEQLRVREAQVEVLAGEHHPRRDGGGAAAQTAAEGDGIL